MVAGGCTVTQPVSRTDDLDRFYALLSELAARVGGSRVLRETNGRAAWPQRGVYFFFEPGETREDGRTPRVVRVGTHAVSEGSGSTLWGRLRAHRGMTSGTRAGGGNHRASIFRFHVGTALLARDQLACSTWGRRSSAPRDGRDGEHVFERMVSDYIGSMPFIWVEVADAPGMASDRAHIEANAIGLLSNRGRWAIDPPSSSWLGHHADRVAVRESGLWNVRHADATHEESFLDRLAGYISRV